MTRADFAVARPYSYYYVIFFVVSTLVMGSWYNQKVFFAGILKSVEILPSQEDGVVVPWEPMPISFLTRGNQPLPKCTYPYVPVSDIIAKGKGKSDPYLEADGVTRRKIPKIIHLAWVSANDEAPRQGRCMHYLQAETFQVWHQAWPTYSVYFHDDDAVDSLLTQAHWPDFPQLTQILKCAKMRGAMLVDIWRVLVLYRYGGFYADLDLWPKPDFTEDTIPSDVGFFAFSDAWARPTQGCFGMAPGHPVGYYNIHEILSRISDLDNIAQVKLIFVTGPEAFKFGYGMAFGWRKELIFGEGTFEWKYNATAKKIGNFETHKVGLQTNVDRIDPISNMTYKEKIKADTGVLHWKEERTKMYRNNSIPQVSCREYLYSLERETTRFPS